MNKLTELRRRAQSLFFPSQKQRDEGAGIVEYAAILILVAAVAVGVFALGIPDQIRGSIDSNISQILQTQTEPTPEEE